MDPRLELSTRRVWLKDEAPLDTTDPRVTVAEDRVTIADLGKGDEGRLDQEIFSILFTNIPLCRYECQVFTEYDKTSSSGLLTVLSDPPSFTSVPNNIRNGVNIGNPQNLILEGLVVSSLMHRIKIKA